MMLPPMPDVAAAKTAADDDAAATNAAADDDCDGSCLLPLLQCTSAGALPLSR